MKQIRESLIALFVMSIMCISSLTVIISCIGSADDDTPSPPAPDTLAVAIDSTEVLIDSLYAASKENIEGEWMGQYIGFDARQRTTSAIRRMVYFAPDGFYDSHVQGIANIADTIVEYKEFEHEHGTYSFDTESQMMTFQVEYDSLLDFRNDVLVLNPMKANWTERMWFSYPEEGRRDWIRTDESLTVPDDHTARVVYKMSQE